MILHDETLPIEERLAIAKTYAGIRQARIAKSTGTVIVVLDGIAAGLDTEAGRWQTICDDHSFIISHETLADARYHAARPLSWCEECVEATLGDMAKWAEEAR
jgi:hypothetical protein